MQGPVPKLIKQSVFISLNINTTFIKFIHFGVDYKKLCSSLLKLTMEIESVSEGSLGSKELLKDNL
jgi:hypothetical protein